MSESGHSSQHRICPNGLKFLNRFTCKTYEVPWNMNIPHWPSETRTNFNWYHFLYVNRIVVHRIEPFWTDLDCMYYSQKMQFQAALECTSLSAQTFSALQSDTNAIPVDKLNRKFRWIHCWIVVQLRMLQTTFEVIQQYKESIATAQRSQFHCSSADDWNVWEKSTTANDVCRTSFTLNLQNRVESSTTQGKCCLYLPKRG